MSKFIVLIVYMACFLGAAMLTDGWQAAPLTTKVAAIGAVSVLGLAMFAAAWLYEAAEREDRKWEDDI